jgi:hypothetical protein
VLEVLNVRSRSDPTSIVGFVNAGLKYGVPFERVVVTYVAADYLKHPDGSHWLVDLRWVGLEASFWVV